MASYLRIQAIASIISSTSNIHLDVKDFQGSVDTCWTEIYSKPKPRSQRRFKSSCGRAEVVIAQCAESRTASSEGSS